MEKLAGILSVIYKPPLDSRSVDLQRFSSTISKNVKKLIGELRALVSG